MIALILAGALGWAGHFEAVSVAQGVSDLQRWIDRGGMVFSVERDGGIPGEQCLAGAQVPIVVAAGGASAQSGAGPATVAFDRSPGVEYSVIAMTKGAVGIAGGGPLVNEGWIVGQTALEELGLGEGDLLRSGGSSTKIGYVVGGGQRQLGYDRDVIRLTTGRGERFLICWVELTPAAFGIGAEIIAGFLPYDDAVIRPFLRTEPEGHPAVRYLNRPSRFAWVAAGLAIGGFWGLWSWVRRRELALYRSLHMPPAGIAILATGEALLVTGPAAVIAALVVATMWGATPATILGAWSIAAGTVLGILIATLAVWPIATRNLAVAAKDL